MTETVVKRSVSLAIHDESGRVLLVQRPADDEYLPLVWGLPAASLRADEDWEDAVRRAGRDKLGLAVEPGRVLGAGGLDRARYRLEMRLYEARYEAGEPVVPQPVDGVTQYEAWRWAEPRDLAPAAEAGSLCSRLYLDWPGRL
jgi:ADP-ribose pyrophosphatase YjhB (NUDIX family)